MTNHFEIPLRFIDLLDEDPMDVYGHLFTKAEDDVELFGKMEEDLMAA